MKNEKTLNQLILKANSKIGERISMPSLKAIHELLNSYNIYNHLYDLRNNDNTLIIFPSRKITNTITLENKSTRYSSHTRHYAKQIIEIINN